MKLVHFLYRKEHEEYISDLMSVETEDEILFYLYDNYEELASIDFSAVSHLVVVGSMPEVKRVMEFAREHEISMGILPLAEQTKLTKILDLPKKKEDAFLLAIKPCEKKIDMFYCDDIPVISRLRHFSHQTLVS